MTDGEFLSDGQRVNRAIRIVEGINAMIDPAREVTLVAGDTTYVLYAGNRALRLLERETGRPLPELLQEMQGGSVGMMTIALWAMLQREHPDLTVDDVDDIIDTAGYDVIGAAVGEAANRAFATTGGDDAGKAMALNGASPGTGKRSSRPRSQPG